MSLDFMLKREHGGEVFWRNITHNLNRMAEEAGLYEHLWHPQVERARDLVAPLTEGLKRLKSDPERFRLLDAPNGWGKYENFVPFVEAVLEACKKHPECLVRVSI